METRKEGKSKMRVSTIEEYNKELLEFFHILEEKYSKVVESLGVVDDYFGFKLELAMIGLRILKKELKE